MDSRTVGLFSACLPEWEARRVVDVARAIGFSAIEWGCGPGEAIERPGACAEVRDLCRSSGLAVSGLSVQDPRVTFATPGRAAKYVRLASELGSPHVRFFAPPYRGGLLKRELQRAREGVDRLVELGAPLGVAVLVETSPATLAPGPDAAAVLVERHAPELAGVVYDPGNMTIEGHLAPRLAIARLGRHLRHVHVKNVSWSRRNGSWQWRHAAMARGMVDWREIVSTLAAARYRGGYSIDHLAGKPSARLLRAEREHLLELGGTS